jgi:hypothetical protein
MRNPTIRALPF